MIASYLGRDSAVCSSRIVHGLGSSHTYVPKPTIAPQSNQKESNLLGGAMRRDVADSWIGDMGTRK